MWAVRHAEQGLNSAHDAHCVSIRAINRRDARADTSRSAQNSRARRRVDGLAQAPAPQSRGVNQSGQRRRRGRDVDIPWRRVAAPPPRPATWTCRGDESRRRRGRDVNIPWRRASRLRYSEPGHAERRRRGRPMRRDSRSFMPRAREPSRGRRAVPGARGRTRAAVHDYNGRELGQAGALRRLRDADVPRRAWSGRAGFFRVDPSAPRGFGGCLRRQPLVTYVRRADTPWRRVAAPPRPRRGYSVEPRRDETSGRLSGTSTRCTDV